MDLQLTDKVAVVTGASRGIGLAIVRSLAAEGAYVVAGSQHGSPELEALAETGRTSTSSPRCAPPGPHCPTCCSTAPRPS